MKIAHLSDFHFYHPPGLWGAVGKRALGLANLYLKGRIDHFSGAVARQAIASVCEAAPDLVIISGDLTALASPHEFELAREALDPLLSRVPTVIVPGNHDCYTRAAARSHRIAAYFGGFIRCPEEASEGSTYPTLHVQDEVAVIGLNPSRFGLGSSGLLQAGELDRLEGLLAREEVRDRFIILVIHYPLLNREGVPTSRFWRKLHNRERLMDILEATPVDLVLHGHDHLRYVNLLPQKDRAPTYLYNSGSAAFSRGFDYPIPASYNLYTVAEGAFTRVIHCDRRPEGFVHTYDGPPMGHGTSRER